MKDENKETIIKNKPLFDTWCNMVASQVLSKNILDLDSVATTIKVSVLENESLFVECMLDKLNSDMFKLKKKAQLMIRSGNKKDYIELGYKIASLKERIKTLNKASSKQKAITGDKRKKLWNYIWENHNDIFNEFMDSHKSNIETK